MRLTVIRPPSAAIIGVNSPDGKGNLEAFATYRSVQAVNEGGA